MNAVKDIRPRWVHYVEPDGPEAAHGQCQRSDGMKTFSIEREGMTVECVEDPCPFRVRPRNGGEWVLSRADAQWLRDALDGAMEVDRIMMRLTAKGRASE